MIFFVPIIMSNCILLSNNSIVWHWWKMSCAKSNNMVGVIRSTLWSVGLSGSEIVCQNCQIHHFASASRILKPRLSLTHSHREFQARGFVNKSLSLFNVFNFLVWSVFIKSDTSEWHVLLSNQKINWNGSRTQRHPKQDSSLWNAAHRLNRKLFFRPCQYIRERENREGKQKQVRSFVIFSGSLLYLHSGSVLLQTDRRVLSFLSFCFFNS